jgi:D-amino-acid oxidase
MIKLLLTILAVTVSFANVVHLTPPLLNQKTIRSEIACNRPMRLGKFNISTEKFGTKTIVNCLGHGGSGWTTLFGSVNQAIQLFEQSHSSKDTPIRVLGSGCMGLLSAIELTRLGYKVTGIWTKELYDIPSWRATGYFALVSVKTSPEEQENLNAIGMDTFKTYQIIDQGVHPYLSHDTVRMIPVYCSSDTDPGVDDLALKGIIPPREEVTIDFGNGVQYSNFVKYMTYFMDVTKIMRQLTQETAKLGIPIILKEIHSFDQVDEEIVFNCTGLGGRVLNNDQNVVPVRGHLLMLDESSGIEHMDYMIYTKDPHFEGKYIYMFPKPSTVTSEVQEGYPSHGLLGGTFIPLPDDITAAELKQMDEENFADLRLRNALFFTGKPFPEK